MEETYRRLAQRVMDIWTEKKALGQERIIILLAGPPGSGKSTIAKNVAGKVASLPDCPSIVTLSADGFHLPLATLRKLPNASEALQRRGAPWTFDGEGVIQLVRDLRQYGARKDLDAPTFDHAAKDPVMNGVIIPGSTQVCLLEGNYILVDQPPWDLLSTLADDRRLIQVDEKFAFHRIVRRHLDTGIETGLEAAMLRARSNDIVNGEYVMKHSKARYDVLIESLERWGHVISGTHRRGEDQVEKCVNFSSLEDSVTRCCH